MFNERKMLYLLAPIIIACIIVVIIMPIVWFIMKSLCSKKISHDCYNRCFRIGLFVTYFVTPFAFTPALIASYEYKEYLDDIINNPPAFALKELREKMLFCLD